MFFGKCRQVRKEQIKFGQYYFLLLCFKFILSAIYRDPEDQSGLKVMTALQVYKEKLDLKALPVQKDRKETPGLRDSQESEEKLAHKASKVNQVLTGRKVALDHQDHPGQLDLRANLEKLGCLAIQ